MRTVLAAVTCLVFPVVAQGPREVTFEERRGVVLANDKLELTVLAHGGAMAELVLRDDAERMSPLWNPIRMAREAGQKATFGYSLGHFVCVDGFGPVSAEERAAGLPGHGEAHMLEWSLRKYAKQGNRTTLAFSVELPLLQENFTRRLEMVDGENVVYVASELENLLPFDRPVNWAEHATIGSPFLETGKTVVDMPVSRAETRPYRSSPGGLPHRLASGEEFRWPMAPLEGGGQVDMRAAPPDPNSGDHTTCLLDTSRPLVWVTALHPAKRLLLGYVFRREEFPWLQSWENYPPNGKLARGLEFSTQPYDVPRREAIGTGKMFDAPTYRWLPAKSKIGSRFLMFYTRTPEGFRKVDDVRVENGAVVIEGAGRRITLPASLPI